MTSRRLFWLGLASVPIYIWALVYGPFRPHRIEPFFLMFIPVFILYALACYYVLRPEPSQRSSLIIIVGLAVMFNALLLPTQSSLSDDMYRYVWDGRVQGNGINPYRYPPDVRDVAFLRDAFIWPHINRPTAVTV